MDQTAKQPRNPNDLLIFQNIDNEDFEWQYDAIRTPLPYFIAAGQVRELPFYIARHGIEKLVDRILQKANKNHMNPLFRKEERDKIVLGVKQINQARDKSPQELALEALKRKKDADPYEELFKEREVVQQQQAEAELAKQRPAQPFYQTQYTPPAATPTPGVPAAAPAQGTPLTQQPVVPNPAPPTDPASAQVMQTADPERLNLYNFLTHRAHLDLTHEPTREKLDAMTVDQIKEEFGPEYPEIIDPTRGLVPDSKATLEEDGMPVTNAGRPVTPTVPPQPVAQPIPQPAPASAMPQPVPTPTTITPPAAPQVSQPVISPVQPPVATIPVATPAPAPIRPNISMNPQAPAAPLLDQQLQQVK